MASVKRCVQKYKRSLLSEKSNKLFFGNYCNISTYLLETSTRDPFLQTNVSQVLTSAKETNILAWINFNHARVVRQKV